MITLAGVTSDKFGAREIGQLFGLSMQTSVDEVFTNGHMDMKFIEFVEGMARVSDKALRHIKFGDEGETIESVPTPTATKRPIKMTEIKLDV